MDLKLDVTHKEGIWGRNATNEGEEKVQEVYPGTAIATVNRPQKSYIFFQMLKLNYMKLNFFEKFGTLNQEPYWIRERS